MTGSPLSPRLGLQHTTAALFSHLQFQVVALVLARALLTTVMWVRGVQEDGDCVGRRSSRAGRVDEAFAQLPGLREVRQTALAELGCSAKAAPGHAACRFACGMLCRERASGWWNLLLCAPMVMTGAPVGPCFGLLKCRSATPANPLL